MIYLIILLILLVLTSAFFSASETALIGISKIKLRNLVVKGRRNANIVHDLISKKLNKVIVTILMGNNFVNIAISSIVTAVAIYLLGPRRGVIVATFCVSMFVLVFCEIVPKIFAVRRTEKVSLFIAPIMAAIVKILGPIADLFTKLGNLVIRILGGIPPKRSPLVTEEEIRMMIELGKEEGVLTDEERKMLYRIFEFGDTFVSEAMIEKDKIIAVDINASQQQLLDLFEQHSRVPVYENSTDNIIGIAYANEALRILTKGESIVIKDLMEEPYFIEPTKRVNVLLMEFQKKKLQIAIIADENKKTLGLVTLEDLLEEIVGEIEEE
ncbi:MAG: hemolysin family protein [Candidatus Omnitrophota bacterium]